MKCYCDIFQADCVEEVTRAVENFVECTCEQLHDYEIITQLIIRGGTYTVMVTIHGNKEKEKE